MTDVQKIVDYILTNVCLIDSPGLYHGKAGISLSLFEASKYLQNEDMENKAFSLLQEALILKGGDFSFENGLTGIGYVLCYLIENRFIDADFDEIFGEQYEKTVKSLADIEKKPEMLLNALQVIYFLSSANKIKPNDERLQKIIQKIFEGLELFLIVQFQDFLDLHYVRDKMTVLRIYEIYLKLLDFSDYKSFSRSLFDDYVTLYKKGRVVGSIGVGYYLGMLTKKYRITECDDVVKEHIENGIRDIHTDMLSLRERIDVSKLLSDVESNGIVQLPDTRFDCLPNPVNINSSSIDYGEGLSRLLLFYAGRQTELL